jgi:ABC-type sulfate transport system permease component
VDAALALSVVLLVISFALLMLFRRWLKAASYGVS